MKRLTLPSRNTAACGCESKLPTGWKEMGAGNPNPNGKRQTRPLLASRKNSVSLSRPPARQAPPAGSLTSITLELTSRTGQRGGVSVPAPTRNSRVSLLRLLGVPGLLQSPQGGVATGAPLCDWLPAPLLHWCQTILAPTWPSKEGTQKDSWESSKMTIYVLSFGNDFQVHGRSDCYPKSTAQKPSCYIRTSI
ncbi:coiled-coil domain-containing protein 3 isoform X1 [Panthera uncia]|uniref:coiled-coil domain-containing protein 3 isoform X1 n=1 Tax=Panthera uncia TaxID=29064 RepID=UPI0020FFA921|nr:coiled-coil domain-containing protein 3 isoform X1 [Panthera uncia]XP_049480548.1 coiled-coil domain-containing protein 3 isoform X1 [Panthera uncia]